MPLPSTYGGTSNAKTEAFFHVRYMEYLTPYRESSFHVFSQSLTHYTEKTPACRTPTHAPRAFHTPAWAGLKQASAGAMRRTLPFLATRLSVWEPRYLLDTPAAG